jgi:hypothetical protein
MIIVISGFCGSIFVRHYGIEINNSIVAMESINNDIGGRVWSPINSIGLKQVDPLCIIILLLMLHIFLIAFLMLQLRGNLEGNSRTDHEISHNDGQFLDK